MADERRAAVRLGSWLKERRLSQGWKLQALARRAGLDHSTLSKIERAVSGRVPPAETLDRLAIAYQVSLPELRTLIEGEGIPRPAAVSPDEVLEEYLMHRPIAIPVYQHPAHAGHQGSAVLDYVYVERAFAVNRDLLCVPVIGDCMQPRIEPGDRVIVDRGLEATNGRVVVAVVEEEVMIRRFFLAADHIVLRCDNLEYADIETTEAEIVGVVVEVRKRP